MRDALPSRMPVLVSLASRIFWARGERSRSSRLSSLPPGIEASLGTAWPGGVSSFTRACQRSWRSMPTSGSQMVWLRRAQPIALGLRPLLGGCIGVKGWGEVR